MISHTPKKSFENDEFLFSGWLLITSSYADSFTMIKIPVIINEMLSPSWRTDLNQEAFPKGSQLTGSKNHGVSVCLDFT